MKNTKEETEFLLWLHVGPWPIVLNPAVCVFCGPKFLRRRKMVHWMTNTWNLTCLLNLSCFYSDFRTPRIWKHTHVWLEFSWESLRFLSFFPPPRTKTFPAHIGYSTNFWSDQLTAGCDSVQIQDVPYVSKHVPVFISQQIVLKSGSWKCECNAAQQPGKVRTSLCN